jgi:hypothetical protein
MKIADRQLGMAQNRDRGSLPAPTVPECGFTYSSDGLVIEIRLQIGIGVPSRHRASNPLRRRRFRKRFLHVAALWALVSDIDGHSFRWLLLQFRNLKW